MAVYFSTENPSKLLSSFDAAIALDSSKGGISTWKKLPDGSYTHEAAQWHRKAFFFPKIESNRLTFNIIRPEGDTVSVLVYAYYHGHLIQTMLRHFDMMFTLGSATALAVTSNGDLV